MALALALLAIVLAAYLIGSIPFGYLAVRLIRGIDIRQHGSGNIGATNVGRVLGWPFFALVFVLDFAKGAGPVLAARGIILLMDTASLPSFLQADGIPVLAGLAAIVGHMWPIYLGFRGGKGVATGAGVMTMLLPLPTLFALATWIMLAIVTRYVSLSSIAAAAALCLGRFAEAWPAPFSSKNLMLTLFCIVGAGLIVVRHRANLVRLWHGTEPKIGQRHAVEDARTDPHRVERS